MFLVSYSAVQWHNRPEALSRPPSIPSLNPRNAHLKYASDFPQSKRRLAWSLLMLRRWEYSKQHLWNIYRNMKISLYFNYLFYTRGTITIKWAHCRKVTQCSFTEIMMNILNLFCCSVDWKRNQWKDLFRVKPHPLILNAAQSTCRECWHALLRERLCFPRSHAREVPQRSSICCVSSHIKPLS